ncbi:MAG TPA: sensor histidine kinase KdpD [Polyangiales bacterium]|nr:sensor histidine kinase KdpD [Polyangiales bacterium]
MSIARPDPDELLRRVQAAEAASKRGKLRIFFGFAPGVGKTYRMLQVARDLALVQGSGVVVGVVETHLRAETQAMTRGLEILPRKRVEYRGRVLEEFDLDAALARKPDLLLVDELAHTNVPGSRHPKRWNDVLELLDAGIDVLSTVNVQHVESLNDVVSQITGIEVRETVPDSVFDRADAIELVDIAPEELLRRLREGKVYVPEQAQRAMENFFQRGNLLALRELALRRTAQHVDEDVREYRVEHGVAVPWPAGERILVGVGPAPSSGRLIRAAARMAGGLRCPWIAAYVEGAPLPMSDADRERLEAHLRLVESLGGTVTRLSGVRVSDALLGYARRTNVTRIVIGKPTHGRLRDRLRGSLLDEVVRGSGEIDVHVISGNGAQKSPEQKPDAAAPRAQPLHYALAAALVGATLGLALVLHAMLQLPDPQMLFLAAVMFTAVWLGRAPAMFAAALGVACYDFFFIAPIYMFDVADRRYLLTFLTMFGVGLLLSSLAGRLKRQERDAISREQRTAVLYTLSRELAGTDDPHKLAEISARHAASIFAARVVLLQRDREGELQISAAHPTDTTLDAKDFGVAKWAFEHGELAGFGTDTLPASASVCAPLRLASTIGVLTLLPLRRAPLRVEQRAFLELFCRQVAAALERVSLLAEARASSLRAKTEEMRSSLLSAVSHDLRTPLGSITGAGTSLRDDAALSDAQRRELIESICAEAGRLERLVTNLLDMTRLESGALQLKRDWVPLDECIGSALTRLEERLGEREILVTLEPALPLLLFDPVLIEQLFVNLLENAAKYTPAGTRIEIGAWRQGDSVVIDVLDHGPGLPSGSEEKVFDKFYRGSHTGVSGAGLGLPICRGIVEAHGGTIRAERRANAGALFRITLPVGGQPPTVPQPEEAAA